MTSTSFFGQWSVRNRKLVDVTDPGCSEWVEFDAISEVSPILFGIGHVDQMKVAAPADGSATLRRIHAETVRSQ